MKIATLTLVLFILAPVPARAEEPKIPVLVIKDHKFTPDTLKVKANERFKITVE